MSNATWIPGAGGYVYNGKVVSKTPIYDTNGRQIVETSIEQINNPNSSTNTAQTVNANNAQVQTGATISQTATANKSNSDMQTAIGSLGSTNNNTQTTGTAVSSPAMNSPQTNTQVQDPVQKYMTDYSTALGNQDLGGQISALIELDKYNVSQGGQPQYSEIIGQLQSQNTEQVTNTVNEYANQIANATMSKNEELANGLRQELASFRQSNNYNSAVENMQAELETEYAFAYMQGINDITNGILALLGEYKNFQYDPYSDPALQMAQGYAISSVKEQMNSTGMYYSSMTQSAITKAVNELIPIYEQMAKDEIMENISLLQNTASYLLNLEQAQFDMWASQLELKILKNQERRADIESAWERVNNLGYVDNEASLTLGLEVGTLSPETRKFIMEEEATIRAEERALANQKELAEFNKNMQLEILDRENYLAKNLASYKAGLSGSSNSSNSASVQTQISDIQDYTKEPSGDLTLSQLIDTAQNLKEQGIDTGKILEEIYTNAKDIGAAYGAIASANIDGEYIFDNEYIRKYGLAEYANYLETQEGRSTPQDLLETASQGINQIMTKQANGTISGDSSKIMQQKYAEDSVVKIIDENAMKYSNKYAITREALTNSVNSITTFSSALYENNSNISKELTIANYKYLFDTIANSNVNGNNEFDAHWAPNEGNWAKDIAIKEIIKDIEDSEIYDKDTKEIVNELTKYKNELKTKKLIG